MLSSEFNHEMGALLRSLELKVRSEPSLLSGDDWGGPQPNVRASLDHIERSIVTLVALHISLRTRRDSDS